MGKRSRNKGHAFERQIAQDLRQSGIFPNAHRQLEYQENNCNGVDLADTGNLAIQCKRYKNYCPVQTIKEIRSNRIPVVITKADREDAMVIISYADFKKILADIGAAYENLP